MLNVIQELKLNSSIASISFRDDYILVLDTSCKLYILESKTLSVVKTYTLLKAKLNLHKYSKVISSSSSSFISIPDKSLESLIAIEYFSESSSVKAIKRLSWHSSKIEVSKFSKDGQYLATGGEDGKSFVFQLPKMDLVTSLPNRPDFISSFAFSKNSKLLAASCYNKTVMLYDLDRNKLEVIFGTVDVVDDLMFFENDSKIFYITQNGASGIYNVFERETESVNNNFSCWPTSISITNSQEYAVVGTRKNSLYIVRLTDNITVLNVNVEIYGISTVRIYKDSVIVGFVDGTLKVFDFEKHVDELKQHLDRDRFKEAKEILKKNIFLTIHPYYRKFDKVWPDKLKEAIELLSEDKISQAIELVEPFVDDPKKRDEFNLYLSKKNLIKDLIELVENNDFTSAYALVEDKKYLRETEAYERLERKWRAIFAKARKLLEEDFNLNKKSVQEMLKPFLSIETKKNLIGNLLTNPRIFKDAEIAIKNKNFKNYFGYVKKAPFLKDTELYKKTVVFGDELLSKILKYENEENFVEAKRIAKALVNFDSHFKIAKDKITLIELKEQLIVAIESRKYKIAYDLILENPALTSVSKYEELEEKFNIIFEDAKKDAFLGRVEDVIHMIIDYYNIKYWESKVAAIIKIAYVNEINDNKKRRGVNWLLTFKNYVSRFGIDAEIEKIAIDVKAEDMLEKVKEYENALGYKKLPFLESIVV